MVLIIKLKAEGKMRLLIRYLIIISFLLCNRLVLGQPILKMADCATTFDSISKRLVYQFVDSEPSFPGGFDSLYSYLFKNLKYPPDIDVAGMVCISFIVEEDGRITNERIVKSLAEPCDKGAMDAIRNMPRWIPGKCKGKTVPVIFILPLKFELL
jgi:TonB family protein